MKGLYFYSTLCITLVTILGADSLITANILLFIIFAVASFISILNLFWIGYTEEDIKKYLGYNLFIKIIKYVS